MTQESLSFFFKKKKITARGNTMPDFKIYHKATVWYLYKDRDTDQWNKTDQK